MNYRNKLPLATLSLAAGLALAGCGGGGDGGNTSSTGSGTSNGGDGTSTASMLPPLSSVDALVSYLKMIIASSSDTAVPVQLGDNPVLPTSDTAPATAL